MLRQPLERLHENGEALSLLRPAHEQQPELVRPRLRVDGRRVDVDAVGDDAVLAPVPASPGPGGGLRDGDPSVELVELAAGSEQVGDPVGDPLGRVGVEGPDHRGVGEGAGVPGEHRRGRLVHVDDVEASGVQLAAHLEHGAGEGGQVGDRAVGAVPHAASHRDQVVGAASPLGRGAVEHSAEAVRRVPRSQHAKLVTPFDQRLGERLDVAVDPAGVGPRVGGDDRDPQRVTPGCARIGPAWGMDCRYGQLRNPREHSSTTRRRRS